MPRPRRSDTTVQPSLGRVELRATRPHAILGTVPKTVATQAPRWLMTRSNLMLEGKAVQASAIEHLGKASPRLHIRLRRPHIRLRRPLPMVPRMSAPPLNLLPAIRVDARRAMRSLTPDMA